MEAQENEDWQLSLDIDDSDLCLTPFLRSSTSHQTRVEKALTKTDFSKQMCRSENEDLEPVRIIPGPADDECFTSGPWVSAVDFVLKNRGIVSGCLGNISKFMKKGKLEQVVAILNPKAPNALGDLTVTLKDPTGSVTGSVHHKVFNEGTGYRRNHFTKGAALILANVLVFSPKQYSHYLNITIRNIVKVFNRDTGPENVSGLNQGGVLYSGGMTLDG
ncbi:hypothetical protein CTI12_AA175590 [Artemisia annua]|uniref:Homologous recombination OB-fold protein OB-fold domain-containing protein n=1 Tax=Artemisia annua TaxID=35608 RepID=A0A2U1P9P2_ARTAN|nr:hypothetical protein CTI12_AA175590 [Artemisia annua]